MIYTYNLRLTVYKLSISLQELFCRNHNSYVHNNKNKLKTSLQKTQYFLFKH